MNQVLKESVRLLEAGETHIICTVVRTDGMTPQKAGAKQLIRQDGSRIGTLGGGCVEGDIWYLAKEILRAGGAPEFHEYELTADIAERDGLVCGGKMFFFIEPQQASQQRICLQKERLAAAESGPALLSAIVVRSALANIEVGQSVLIRSDGSTAGPLNNPELIGLATDIGAQLTTFGASESVQTGSGVELLVEAIAPPPTLIILGGGHIGKAVCEFALRLDFRVVVIDDRPEFANKQRFPLATPVVADFENPFETVVLNSNSFILVATRGHKFDDQATLAAAKSPARYIGLLGSRRKNLLIFKELLKKGVPLSRVQQVNAPVGLDIGARTPAEIAVSIVAEIIQIIRGGDGRPLRISAAELQREL